MTCATRGVRHGRWPLSGPGGATRTRATSAGCSRPATEWAPATSARATGYDAVGCQAGVVVQANIASQCLVGCDDVPSRSSGVRWNARRAAIGGVSIGGMYSEAHPGREGLLRGKTAIITGGEGSIGLATARAFAAAGARVCLIGLVEDQLRDGAAALGAGATWVVADVADSAAV